MNVQNYTKGKGDTSQATKRSLQDLGKKVGKRKVIVNTQANLTVPSTRIRPKDLLKIVTRDRAEGKRGPPVANIEAQVRAITIDREGKIKRNIRRRITRERRTTTGTNTRAKVKSNLEKTPIKIGGAEVIVPRKRSKKNVPRLVSMISIGQSIRAAELCDLFCS